MDLASAPLVAGYDLVSSLGTSLEDTWRRAVAGESGIGPLTRFPLTEGFPVTIAGEVGPIDRSPYGFLSARELAHWKSPIFPHALLVVHRALARSGFAITPEIAPRVAVTFSSAVGGQDALVAADRRMQETAKLPLPMANPNACINMVGGKVAILTGATGPIVATIAACATGSASIITGAMLLAQGRADVALCGAVDFALVEPIVAGFATMNGAVVDKPGLPPELPGRASRPFSIDRRGFVISEGAGCVILVTPQFARRNRLDCPFALAGWSMTSDAFHFVAPRLETVTRCISESIADAGITPGDIDAVNAHAASTRVGDRVEADALRRVFGDTLPPVSANKSMLGHAMGASSAIETILALEGMRHQRLLPTINHTADPEIPLDCVAEGQRSQAQTFVLKNAFGFGGCNACTIFKRLE
jgi:3-oxoacyl-[acyl-carrier-protein] synthase II